MWWSYEDVKEQKKRLEREIAKRVKRGERFEVLSAPEGQKKLCNFVGKNKSEVKRSGFSR